MEECSLLSIGNRIEALRKEKGITQQQLAKKFLVRREVVTKWETGLQDLKTDNIIKLADYFGVTCDYLLRGIKSENVDINRKLGLSDEAIANLEVIQELSKKAENNKLYSYTNTLDIFISNDKFAELIEKINSLRNNINDMYTNMKEQQSIFDQSVDNTNSEIYKLMTALNYVEKFPFMKVLTHIEYNKLLETEVEKAFKKLYEDISISAYKLADKPEKEVSDNGKHNSKEE